MSKKVRVTLEIDGDFLKTLNTNIGLNRSKFESAAQLTPPDILAILVWGEARGFHDDEVFHLIPPQSRSDAPDVITDERRVYDEDGRQIAGPHLVRGAPITQVGVR